MSKMKFYYVRNPKKNRDITIVSNVFYVDNKPFVEFGYTFRNNHDLFKKEEGRQYAVSRMRDRTPEYSGTVALFDVKHKEIMTVILDWIISQDNVPKKFRPDIKNAIEHINRPC